MRISDWSSDVCSSDLLGVCVRNKRPKKIGEFGPAGRDHEAHRAIHLAWRMPLLGEAAHFGADRCPYLVGGAEDHLAREDRIYFKSCADGGAACGLIYGVSACAPFDCEQNCFFPREIGRASCRERVCPYV